MSNPFKDLTKTEWILWICSMIAVVGSNLILESIDWLTLFATLIGVTSLIFAAKGNVWAQILMIFFSILYGIISYRFRYWGEMITYLGMTMPMAIWSTFTWLKDPSKENSGEVKIQKLGTAQFCLVGLTTIIVTVLFYFILKYFETPNLIFSTISVATSFLAASLTMLRSSWYALGYAANDLVLIILWILASAKNPQNFPVAVNFAIFLVNDAYGFFSWKEREKIQT